MQRGGVRSAGVRGRGKRERRRPFLPARPHRKEERAPHAGAERQRRLRQCQKSCQQSAACRRA
ncbi:MAG: hypothetical protein OXU61_08050 [Gammaproteobacteria bacterium]|nr:hypothetical protein [Gammaproteobacteria bacterium]